MIVYVMGAHGSGKSTLVRGLMSEGEWEPVHYAGRRRPLGYRRGRQMILGHYETRMGGADTVRPLDFLVKYAERRSAERMTVIMEGVGQAGIMRRLAESEQPVRVLLLDVPLRTCVGAAFRRGSRMSDEMIRRSLVKSERAAALFSAGTVKTVARKNAPTALREVIGWL